MVDEVEPIIKKAIEENLAKAQAMMEQTRALQSDVARLQSQQHYSSADLQPRDPQPQQRQPQAQEQQPAQQQPSARIPSYDAGRRRHAPLTLVQAQPRLGQ